MYVTLSESVSQTVLHNYKAIKTSLLLIHFDLFESVCVCVCFVLNRLSNSRILLFCLAIVSNAHVHTLFRSHLMKRNCVKCKRNMLYMEAIFIIDTIGRID